MVWQRVFSLGLYCTVCAIAGLQCFPRTDAFWISHHRTGSSRTRKSIPTLGSTDLLALVQSGTKATETRLFDKLPKDNDDNTKTEEQVEVGTKEYYSGFLSSPIQDETVAERGSGLEQALKLGGGVVVVLIVLVAGFMASNGLL